MPFRLALSLGALPSLLLVAGWFPTGARAAADLYVADYGAQTIYRLPGGAGATPVPFATVAGSPTALAFDAAGNLFVSVRNPPGNNGSGGQIDRVAPDGSISVFAAGLNSPAGLLFDRAGNLLAADQYAHVIYSYTPAGVRSTFYSNAGYSFFGLTFGPGDNNLFATSEGGVERFTLAGVKDASSYALGGGPLGIAFDGAGNLYEANHASNGISKVPPPGPQPFLFTSGLSAPVGLTFDPMGAGTLYESDSGSGSVLAFDLQGNRSTVVSGLSSPYAVVVVPEPGVSIILTVAAGGLAALGWSRRRRKSTDGREE